MSTSSTRPVRVYHIIRRPNPNDNGFHYPREVQHERGLFHQFSTESQELDTGAAHYPVGIVELPNGTVITVAAHLLQFLDAAGAV